MHRHSKLDRYLESIYNSILRSELGALIMIRKTLLSSLNRGSKSQIMLKLQPQ